MRVKYYKHVKSDLCYNITWRNRPTELAGEQQLTRWMFSSNRDYRTYLSPLQLKGTVELVAVSQLSSYQPSKPFLLFGHGSKPLSKYTRVHRLWDTRDEGLFLKILDNPRTDFKRRKWSKRTANNRSFLSLEIPKCPEILIHDKRILKIKLFWSLTDIGIGVCVKTQNRVRGKKAA